MALGDLVIGWLLLRQAEIALSALAGEAAGKDADFYAGKVTSATFFAGNVLPRIESRAAHAGGDQRRS